MPSIDDRAVLSAQGASLTVGRRTLWAGRDRVLHLAGGRFRIGIPDQVLRSEVLSEMYGTTVDVVRSRGRIVVGGGPEGPADHPSEVHHLPERMH